MKRRYLASTVRLGITPLSHLHLSVLHIIHLARLLVYESPHLSLAVNSFLLHLHEVAACAAARHQAVGAAVAFEVVLAPHVAALHHLEDPVAAEV